MKRLLIVAHAPSPNTQRLVEALLRGARHPDITGIEVVHRPALAATPDDIRGCDAILLCMTENLASMSGGMKDFFDRCYYPCLEKTQGLPYALYVRAGHDGTGTRRAVEGIVTGLRWRRIQEPLVCRGAWSDDFPAQCRELGLLMAAGLEAGVF